MTTVSESRRRHEAEALAGRLPPLLVAAERVAATVAQGVHGRRRTGPGDSFWQFRPYLPGDAASRIDWRESAKSDRAFIRDYEWDAAQSVWLWLDRSASMSWRSSRDLPEKSSRGALLGLALGALLLRAGERVAILGGREPPRQGRTILERLAATWQRPPVADRDAVPPLMALPKHGSLVLVGDFLTPLETLQTVISHYARDRVNGLMLQIVDPAEETLPFAGRVRFDGLEEEAPLLINRVEPIRDAYRARFAEHGEALAAAARRVGWRFSRHRTDHPPQAALLALWTALTEGDTSGLPPRASWEP